MTEKIQHGQFFVSNKISLECEELSTKFFSQRISFIKGVRDLKSCPQEVIKEVCFSGRSNVGKSSLINVLTGRKALARTSNKPGRTRELNFFGLSNDTFIVDLPGYGYANVPLSEKIKWNELINEYLIKSKNLRRVFLLIDSRHGVKSNDVAYMEMLDRAAVTFQVIFTKIDKVRKERFQKVLDESFSRMSNYANAFPEVLITSSKKKIGLGKLRATVSNLLET